MRPIFYDLETYRHPISRRQRQAEDAVAQEAARQARLQVSDHTIGCIANHARFIYNLEFLAHAGFQESQARLANWQRQQLNSDSSSG